MTGRRTLLAVAVLAALAAPALADDADGRAGIPSPPQLQCTATVAVEPCPLVYATPIQPGVPFGIEARGYCGIPANATAVFLHVKAGGSGNAPGKLYFWPDGASFPIVSQCNYQSAFSPFPASCHVLVRLGGGTADADNFYVQSTLAINLSAIVEGYIAPASPTVARMDGCEIPPELGCHPPRPTAL